MAENLLTVLRWFNQLTVVFFLQSTVVLILGLLVARLARQHGSLIQAAIYRATFVSVCACPILAVALSWAGVSGFHLKLPIGADTDSVVVASNNSDASLSESNFDTLQKNASDNFVPPEAVANSSFEPVVVRQPSTVADNTVLIVAPPSTTENTRTSSNSISPLIVLSFVPTIWLVGTIVLLFKHFIGLRRIRLLCDSSLSVNESVRHLAGTYAAALQVHPPKVAFHDLIASPCVAGFWSPIVLLPSESDEGAALEKSLIHELAHLSRGDVKWNFVQRVVLAVLFPQPLLWWLVFRMETIAEDVCDDFVVKFTNDRTGYAQQLVDLAESQQILPNIAGLGMFSSGRSALYSRVERILDSSRQLSIRLSGQSVALVFIVLVALSAAGSFFRHQTSNGTSEAEDKLLSVSQPENEIDAAGQGDAVAASESELQEDDGKQSPEQIEIRGVVRDATGKPAPNVEVVIDWLDGEKRAKSDAKGEYWALVPKNAHYLQIRAIADGRLSQGILTKNQSLSEDMVIPIDLAPVRIIYVRIVDKAGVAVEGATVTAISSVQLVSNRRRMDTAVSDAQGNASLLVPIQMPIECVVAIKPGLGIDYQPARFGDKLAFPTEKPVTFPPTPIDLKLTGTQTISVTVESDYGTPLPNAKVKISSIAPKPNNPPSLDSDAIGDLEFVTDQNGNVELNVLPDWCTKAHLKAEIEGYAAHYYEEYDTKFHNGKLTIHASKLVPVSGTVVDENNLPVSGLKLEFQAQGSRKDRNTGFDYGESVTTDAAGKFRVELPEDTGCQAMSATNRIVLENAEPFVIEAGKPVPDQVYRTCKPTRIFGRVTVGPDGKPVSACDVWLVRKAEAGNVPIPNANFGIYGATLDRQISTISNSDGRFEIFAAPGDYMVLRPREQDENVKIFSIHDEREFEWNIHLEKFGKTPLKGQITCNDPGVSLEGLRVHWQYLEQTSEFADRDTQTAKGGSFEFERASHRLLAFIETPDRRYAGFAVMEPDDNQAKITLRPTVVANGVVVDAKSGNPLANSEFQICHQIRWGRSTTSIKFPLTIMTDANGQFQAPGLAVGLKYTIQRVFRGNRHPDDISWRDVHEFTPDETKQIDLGVVNVAEQTRQLSESEMLSQRVDQIFETRKPVADRLSRAFEIAKFANQHVAVLIGDPKSKPIRDMIESTMQNRDLLRVLPDYVLRGVSLPMNEDTRAALAKAKIEVASEDDSVITFFVIDAEGHLLDQFNDRDLLLDGEFNAKGFVGVLQKHALKPVDAQNVLDAALAKAKQENKRLIVQQSATWCAPCWTLSQYFEKTRSVWEKDYVWVKIDNRWTGAIDLMKELRKDASGGVPWYAILDTDRKILATSNEPEGENVGYPTDAKSKKHFRNMIQTTASRLTDSEIDQLISGFENK